jgi:hypothetical protein
MARDRGQATVEVLAAIPLLLLAGAIALQLFATGYALTLADGAAEAGALALAGGRPAKQATLDSLPDWARTRATVAVEGGGVKVRLRPPALVPGLADPLAVYSAAYVRDAAH